MSISQGRLWRRPFSQPRPAPPRGVVGNRNRGCDRSPSHRMRRPARRQRRQPHGRRASPDHAGCRLSPVGRRNRCPDSGTSSGPRCQQGPRVRVGQTGSRVVTMRRIIGWCGLPSGRNPGHNPQPLADETSARVLSESKRAASGAAEQVRPAAEAGAPRVASPPRACAQEGSYHGR